MFTVAGISTLNGQIKMRFANDLVARVKNLQRNDHTDIRLIELPQAMEKTSAAAYLSTLSEFADVDAQTTISEYLNKDAKGTVSKKLEAKADEHDVETERELAAAEQGEQAAPAELTAEDKLAAKRARDAERKREKRAQIKAAMQAEIYSRVPEVMPEEA